MVLLFGSAPPHTSSSSSRLVLSSPRPAAAAQPLETDSRGHSSSLIREPYSGSHSLLSTLYSLYSTWYQPFRTLIALWYCTVVKVQASSHNIAGTAPHEDLSATSQCPKTPPFLLEATQRTVEQNQSVIDLPCAFVEVRSPWCQQGYFHFSKPESNVRAPVRCALFCDQRARTHPFVCM